MKTLPILPALFFILLLSGCNKNSDLTGDSSFRFNDTFQLLINKSAVNNENQLSIRIDSVLNDSRCPSDVVCAWEGNAEVRFILTNGESETKFVLNTHGGDNFRKDTIIDGCSILFVDLKPYPVSTKEISNNEYVAELLIKKK
ncbi:MAG TPA: hypothetical protein PKH79_10300 [Prolixibacteraceae bacterium]|nr:hypothetical protein [Prolixibacteraceae bacterium]HPS13356.1 hypothetical protein [Prolixibacteraceae bacterium]